MGLNFGHSNAHPRELYLAMQNIHPDHTQTPSPMEPYGACAMRPVCKELEAMNGSHPATSAECCAFEACVPLFMGPKPTNGVVSCGDAKPTHPEHTQTPSGVERHGASRGLATPTHPDHNQSLSAMECHGA